MKFKLPFSSEKFKLKKNKNRPENHAIPEIQETFHKQPLEELVREFATSLDNGLDTTTASQLLQKNGPNKIKQKKENLFLKIFGYFFSGFGTIFFLAAIICMLAWRPLGTLDGNSDPVNLALGILLIIIIFIQAAFNGFQDWSSNRVMNSIKNMMPSTSYVIRSGKEMSIPTEEIVVGDIIKLEYGNKVPADCRIIETKDLKFDKSMLTGESEAIEGTIECTDEKYVESKNIAYMTTLVTQGQGKGLVVATGDQTMMGKIAGLTNQTGNKKTSLQVEIHRFVTIICTAAFIAAVIVIVAWAAWLRVQYPNYIKPVALIVNVISVVISFIPDGLPVSVTISLLIIARKMKKSRVLVKNLTVIETLSCVNVIASDKTGTLTQNKMFVASATAGIDKIENLEDVKDPDFQKSVAFLQLISSCGLCNNASFEDQDPSIPVHDRKIKGDATDIAIFKFSGDYENLDKINKTYEIRAEIPFNSKNKWMVKIIKPKDEHVHSQIFGVDDDMESDIVLLKGAPDYLIKKSTHVITPDGHMTSIDSKISNALVKIQNDWCALGQRVLIICKKKCRLEEVMKKEGNVHDLEKYIHNSNDFCIIGLVGIIDPPREGIADVIEKCKRAGIRVFMVTGDYALTAAAIATQIGILTQPQYDTVETMRMKHKNSSSYETNSLLLTGNDLDTLTDEDWRLVTPYREIVFARTTPEQKLKCVKEFQSDKYIVSVTGDGVNDAPALKCADIGIAMGSGSEVAMEASQLVLMDNNFASILVAIENGRLVFDNLRKVILFLLPAGSMGTFFPIIIAIFLGIPLNLSSFGMLLISLITDIPPSLTMMKEPPETDLLARPPRTKKDHLTDKKFLLQAYIFMGVMVVMSSQIMYFIYMKWYMNMDPSQIFLAFDQIYSNYNQSNYEYLKTVIDPSNSTELTNYFVDQYYSAQTVTYTALVMVQTFGNLLCTRTHVKSFFQMPPWDKKKGNRWMFVGQILAIAFLLIFIYVPLFHEIFNTRPIPVQFLFLPLVFCLIIFIADELRKLCVRREWLYFHKFGW